MFKEARADLDGYRRMGFANCLDCGRTTDFSFFHPKDKIFGNIVMRELRSPRNERPTNAISGTVAAIRYRTTLSFPMCFLMARRAECDQILGSVITQAASGLNVMDLKTFHAPTRLTPPTISLQDFAAELAIRFGVKP